MKWPGQGDGIIQSKINSRNNFNFSSHLDEIATVRPFSVKDCIFKVIIGFESEGNYFMNTT